MKKFDASPSVKFHLSAAAFSLHVVRAAQPRKEAISAIKK
jgi:hypothetical protein